MSAVFSLYTLAGFPSLPCIGSVVRFGEKESERRAVITDIKDITQADLITLDKREPMLVCVCVYVCARACVCLRVRTRVCVCACVVWNNLIGTCDQK